MHKTTVERIAKRLVRSKKINKPAVIFLGAGVSVSSGIPTANGLINFIRSSEELNTFIPEYSKGYFEIMEALGPGDRKRVFNQRIPRRLASGLFIHFIASAKINESHLIVALLMQFGLVNCVVTTNFDPMVEKSWILIQKNFKAYDVTNNVNFSGTELSYPSLFYLHDAYQNVIQVNTKSVLDRNRDNIVNILSKIGFTKPWIIIGYSGQDLVFEELSKVETFDEGLFWVGFNNELPENNVQKKLLSDPIKNAHYLEGYDSDSFFKQLIEELNILMDLPSKLALNGIITNVEIRSQIDKHLDADISTQIKITDSCHEWIEQTTLKSLIDKNEEEIHYESSNIFERLFVKIANAFSSNPYIDKAQSNIKNQNFEAALQAAEESIQNQPDDPLGHYYKGVALGEITVAKEASARQDDYKHVKEVFAEAQKVAAKAGDIPSEIERIDAVVNTLWQTEHNKGIFYASDDSVKNTVSNPLEVSIAHLNNATIIQPNSVLTWDVKAQVYYMNNNVLGAVKAMEEVMKLKDQLTVDDYTRMAGYYSLAEIPKKAINTLEEGREEYPTNKDILTRLADAYNNAGETEKAIATIERLIEKEQKNPQFHLVLGTQIYKTVLTLSDSLKVNIDKFSSLQREMKNSQRSNANNIKQQINELVVLPQN